MPASDPPYRDYHDATLEDFVIGPRREIQLRLGLPFAGCVSLRFGAITNFDTVRAFFTKLERPPLQGACWGRIDALRPTADGWLLCLDHAGEVLIQTAKPPTVLPLGAA